MCYFQACQTANARKDESPWLGRNWKWSRTIFVDCRAWTYVGYRTLLCVMLRWNLSEGLLSWREKHYVLLNLPELYLKDAPWLLYIMCIHSILFHSVAIIRFICSSMIQLCTLPFLLFNCFIIYSVEFCVIQSHCFLLDYCLITVWSLFDYCLLYCSWKCIPGIAIP